jgi:hypothetical protein
VELEMDTFGNQTDPHFGCLHIFCLLDFQAAACRHNRDRENEHKGQDGLQVLAKP